MEFLLANPVIRRWAVMLLLALAAGAFGFMKGIDYQQDKDLVKQTAGLVYVAKKTAEAQKIADSVSEKTQDKTEQVRVVYKTITKKEIQYVQTDPHALDVLESSFVRLFNAASLACDPSTKACESVSEPTEDITKADVIRQHNESAELYQTCKIALDGYEEFYQRLRTKINSGQIGDQNEDTKYTNSQDPLPASE